MDFIKRKSVLKSTLAIYTLAAALIFVSGFFIHYGQEAHASKSWGHVMSDGDELVYWTIARGRMMTPRCDGNPYYFEEQGTRHIIPFTTAEITGLISKYIGVPLSWFFPIWHILMPLLLWFVIVVCCWKLWNYPLGTSAAVTLLLFEAILWGPTNGVISKFTRSMDGMAPLFIWISLIFKGDPDNKRHCAAVVLVSAIALWLHPYYAIFGLWITVFECLFSLFHKEGFLKIKLHFYAIGGCIVSGLLYAGYAYYGKNTNPLLMQLHTTGGLPFLSFLLAFLILGFVMSVATFLSFYFKKEITLLDRLVMGWAFFGALVYSFLKPHGQVATHLAYFFPVMLFSLSGWIYEKLDTLKGIHYSFLDKVAGLVFVALLVFFLLAKKDFLGKQEIYYFILIPQYFFILFSLLWVIARFDFVKRVITRKKIVCGIILLLAIGGYWRACHDSLNRDFPFGGGYQWLEQHAQKNAVVLTATLQYEDRDYLPFKTALKSYYSFHGMPWNDGSLNASRQEYRNRFRLGLFLNLLDKMPSYEGWSLDQKLHALKLDYILIPKPSPFFENITRQLMGHLQVMYQDERCLIWKVL